MDERRKDVGRRIKRLRRAAGYRSAKAFAAAIGIHETSVARAEAGYDNVGDGVFGDIETALKLHPGAIAVYLETGDSKLLDGQAPEADSGQSSGPGAKEADERPGEAEQAPEPEPEITIADVKKRLEELQEEHHQLLEMIDKLDRQEKRKAQ